MSFIRLIKVYVIMVLLTVIINCEVEAQVRLTNLPTIYITTQDAADITSKDNYIAATLTCTSAKPSENLTDEVIQIRGRGNSTWNMPKKPYRIKFSRKLHFLDLPANQDNWVLLANYADKTLLRNALAYKLGQEAGFEFTPSIKYVDLVINDAYVGNYMITDQVEVKKDRVNVEKLDASMELLPDIAGGYLLEADGFASGNEKFYTEHGMNIVIKYPDEDDINNSQRQYIRSYVQEFETALFSTNFKDPDSGYRKYVDVTSLVNWYLCNELTGNPDSFWSTYFYKRRDDPHLKFGPLWDFDIAFNNDDRLGDATNKLMADAAHDPKQWIKQLLKDPWLRNEIAKRWNEFKEQNIPDHLIDYLNAMRAELNDSQALNFNTWNILNTIVYRELEARGSYAAEVNFVHDYLVSRYVFLDTKFKVETDGTNEVTAVEYNEIKSPITLSPNPVVENTSLMFESAVPSSVQLTIYDQSGKILVRMDRNTVIGHNVFLLSISELKLSPGIYIVQVMSNNRVMEKQKMVVLK